MRISQWFFCFAIAPPALPEATPPLRDAWFLDNNNWNREELRRNFRRLQGAASLDSGRECYLPSGGLLMLRLNYGVGHDSDAEQIAIAARGEIGRRNATLMCFVTGEAL
jgi:hypothetical protein